MGTMLPKRYMCISFIGKLGIERVQGQMSEISTKLSSPSLNAMLYPQSSCQTLVTENAYEGKIT